jgi:hypothetical protein
MELWIDLICSWVGSATCNFIKILRKENMGTNLQKKLKRRILEWKRYMGTHLHKTWEEVSWAKKRLISICREFEKEVSWQVRLVGATHKL